MFNFNKKGDKKCPFSNINVCEFDFKDKFEELPSSKKTELLIFIFKTLWFKITVYTCFGGIALIFLGAIISFWLDKDVSNDIKIFESLQSWVGVILGIIATLFSIISMFLSFYNLEQQKDSEKQVIELNNNLQNNIIKNVSFEIIKVLEALKGLDKKIGDIPTVKLDPENNNKGVTQNPGLSNFFKK